MYRIRILIGMLSVALLGLYLPSLDSHSNFHQADGFQDDLYFGGTAPGWKLRQSNWGMLLYLWRQQP